MLVCVVFVVLLVASVLASMRWLLCVVTVQKKKKARSVNAKEMSRERIYLHYGLNSFASNFQYYGFNKFEKQ